MAPNGIRDPQLKAMNILVDSSALIHAAGRGLNIQLLLEEALQRPFRLCITTQIAEELARLENTAKGKLKLRAMLARKLSEKYTLLEVSSKEADESIMEACVSIPYTYPLTDDLPLRTRLRKIGVTPLYLTRSGRIASNRIQPILDQT
ncbi:MAG: hypothetical protein M1357_01175 [Candidatus Marsarchaeota archaeon]|nr:hypothetical protein [Candidatus Marsarchaeota archaeon]